MKRILALLIALALVSTVCFSASADLIKREDFDKQNNIPAKEDFWIYPGGGYGILLPASWSQLSKTDEMAEEDVVYFAEDYSAGIYLIVDRFKKDNLEQNKATTPKKFVKALAKEGTDASIVEINDIDVVVYYYKDALTAFVFDDYGGGYMYIFNPITTDDQEDEVCSILSTLTKTK